MNVSAPGLSPLTVAATNSAPATAQTSADAAIASTLAKSPAASDTPTSSTARTADVAPLTGASDQANANTEPPGLAAAKQLKALSEQLVALALIKDPLARAKAAADLYKQYASVAQQYAASGASDRAAAQAAVQSGSDYTQQQLEQASAGAIAAAGGVPTAAPSSTGSTGAPGQADTPTPATATASPEAATVGEAAPSPSATTSLKASSDKASAPASANGYVTDATSSGQAITFSASVLDLNDEMSVDDPRAKDAPVGTVLKGVASNFAPDLYMEEIKSFANMALATYREAVQEARLKGHGNASKTDGEIKAAQDDLTNASKAVEGSGATATGGYTSRGGFESASQVLTTFSVMA
jgi:hypothetical protein